MCPSRSQCPATDTPHKGKKGRKFPARRPHPSSRGPAEKESGHRQEAAETPAPPASNVSPHKSTKGQWGPNRTHSWVRRAVVDVGFPPTHEAPRAVLRERNAQASRPLSKRQREHSRPAGPSRKPAPRDPAARERDGLPGPRAPRRDSGTSFLANATALARRQAPPHPAPATGTRREADARKRASRRRKRDPPSRSSVPEWEKAMDGLIKIAQIANKDLYG